MTRRISLLLIMILMLATNLDARGRRRSSHPFERVKGIVAVSAADQVTIRTRQGDVVVKLLPETLITVDGIASATTVLAEGDKVQAFVWRSSTGVLTAAAINIEVEDEFRGVIQSLALPELVLDTNEGEVTLTVTSETVTLIHGHPVAPKLLVPGMRIEVKTSRGSSGERIALVIRANTSLTGIRGTVTVVDETTMTVLTAEGISVPITLSDLTVVKMEGRVVDRSLIRAGLLVKVKALATDGNPLAIVVEVEGFGDLIDLKGTVTGVGIDSLTIRTDGGDEVTVAVDDETIIRFGGHRVITLSEIVVGDQVRVHATTTDEGGLLAVSIKLVDDDGRYDEFEGTIVAVTGSVLTIEKKDGTTVDVHITSTTRIRRRFEPATVAELIPGTLVELTVRNNSDGSLEALFIAIESDNEVELKGTVVTAGEGTITILTGSGEVTVAFDDDTEFKGGSAEDLAAGVKVEIKAVRRGDGTLLAKKIEIEDRDDEEVEFKGVVVSATEASVTVSTSSGEVTVVFDDRTAFKGGSPTDLTPGRRVEVEAVRRGDTLFAKKIELEDEE